MATDAAEISALDALVRACESDLDQVAAVRPRASELADRVGGELGFRWAMLDLRALLAAPPDDDSVRERYGELLDRHREHPDRLAALRELGLEIRRLEAEGVLPSALVVRSPRRGQR